MIDISKSLKSVGKVKLSGGVVGKTCTVLIVLILTIGALAAASRNPTVIGGAIALVVLVVFVMLWRVINFANAHPEAAILEGAEFLAHQQITLATKSSPSLPASDRREARPIAPGDVTPLLEESEDPTRLGGAS